MARLELEARRRQETQWAQVGVDGDAGTEPFWWLGGGSIDVMGCE